jgi:membrane associated rhomboid family serine protease
VLIIPYQTRFTARTLPVVTLALIIVNALVYFVLQGGDRLAYRNAAEYYFSSQLPAIELTRYAGVLEKRGDRQSLRTLRAMRSKGPQQEAWGIVAAMQRDRDFMSELKAGSIVPPGDPLHATWLEQRQRFEALLGRVVTERFALERGGPLTALLTHQFLHANAMHWFANMLVLLLAGPFAEAALGRLRFLAAYLVSGAVAGALHMLVSDQGLVGASGAISGAMAMVAVLYGLRKVPVFYWVFVYFNTARVPALLLLPVWLLIEAVKWSLSPESRVAYGAHVGGFLAGALCAWLLRPRDEKVDRILDEQFADERRSKQQSTLLEEAQLAASRLDTGRAARAYAELLTEDPGNTKHATAYLNMALLGGNQQMLLDAAVRVLSIRARAARSELRPVYLQMSQPRVLASLPADEHLRLVRRLVAVREDAAALRVIDGLLGDETLKNRDRRQLADCLLGLFTTYARHGLKSQAQDIRERMSTHFPSPGGLYGGPRVGPQGGSRAAGTVNPMTVLDLDTRMPKRY